jgi:RNA polymerase sigma factor (sigma-70 family)
MSPFDPRKPPKPSQITTTSGVKVLLHGQEYAEPEEEAPPPDPFPTAIVFPPGQSLAERNAFIEGLDRQWGPFIWKKLRRPDILPESAKDLHQKALIVLFNQQENLKGPDAKVTGFVDTVVTHLICNHLRRAKLPVEQSAEVEAEEDDAPDPERAVGNAELWQKLQGYVEHLSKEEAEVFKARELHGMIFEIIALAVDRPFSTVVSQHARAMRKLQDMARASERSAALGARRKGRPGGSLR